ncbi:hypothetical protein [Kordiimonas gwangyangensis]|nr:hypothetical protein [Kordiimonas gwangyangensis]
MRLGQERTYIDRALWLRVAKIVQEKGGEEPLDLTTDENAICDGGYEYLYVRVGEKTAYYHFDAMPCEERIEKHDAAGREIVNIFRELAESFDQKSRN